MAEWPKAIYPDGYSVLPPDKPVRMVEVIPADLGRKLYEALKDETAARFEPPDPEDRKRHLKVLARYEREIGE
jgi:hypothetical protein